MSSFINGKKQSHSREKSNTSDGFGEFSGDPTGTTFDSIDHPEQVDEPKEGNGDSFIDDDEWQEADLVAGFSPTSPNLNKRDFFSTSPTARVHQQLDDLAWDAWETPRGPTPGPNNSKNQNGENNDQNSNENFLAAFERMSMAKQANIERKPSPPIIDLREMEKKLASGKGKEGINTTGLRPEDLSFFESFEKNPRAIMANSRTQSSDEAALRGEQLNSMHEAQASPMNIHTSKKNESDNYFDVQDQASTSQGGFGGSPLTRKGSWTEAAGVWAGSFRRTLGSIRGHLPSVQDFYVSEGDDDENEEGKRQTRLKKPEQSQTSSSAIEDDEDLSHHHKHPRKLADLSAYSQTTPFSNHSDPSSSPPGPIRKDSGGSSTRILPIAGHHSSAPISGAPGFNPNARKNWNTGSWSLSSKDEVERRRNPIPVTLLGRREETQEVMEDDLAASLTAHLPKRLQLGKSWKLLYSSDQHGVSLGTLYNKVEVGLDLRKQQQSKGGARKSSVGGVAEAEGWLRGASETTKAALIGASKGGVQRVGGGLHLNEAGLILAIKDDEDHIFGAFINERLRAQSTYYGNGECFLWKQTDERKLKTFDWTGRNDYMVLTESHYLSFGGGEGKYGLWLDGRLEKGISSHCPAFDNEILCNGKDGKEDFQSEGRFECITLEVWACGID